MQSGNIVSIDVQTFDYLPIVHLKDWFDQIVACSEAGAVVIFGSGNGGFNIKETPEFNDWGISRAISIGACYSFTGKRLALSNYNLPNSLDLNSWGNGVTTTGYGDLFQGDETYNRYYTAEFSGTSSATPLIAGALALIQGYLIREHQVFWNTLSL